MRGNVRRYRSWIRHGSVGVIGLAILCALNKHDYLAFHVVAELFGIIVAAGIFMLAWNSRRFLDNNYILFIGIGYLFVAGLHVAHTLLYKGMGPLADYATPDHAAQLWIAARVVTSLTFLIAPLFLGRRLHIPGIFASYLAVCGLIVGLLVTDTFPHCFVEPHGLTPFKKMAEYVISLLFIASAGLLYARRASFSPRVLRVLIGSIAVSVGGELAFTLYNDVYGILNAAGHYLTLVASYLLYLAIIETGLRQPYSLLFWNVKRSEESLRESEERYRRLVELSPEGIAVYRDGRYVYVNPAAAALFRAASPEQVIGRNVLDLVAPEDRAIIEDRIHQAQDLRSSTPLRESQLLCLDGTRLDVERASAPIVFQGQPSVQLLLRDATARKQAERQHAEHLDKLSTLIAVSAKALAQRSIDDLLQHVSDGARELTGARLAIAGHGFRGGTFHLGACSRAEGVPPCPESERFKVSRGGVYAEFLDKPTVLRLSDAQLRAHSCWKGLPAGHAPLRGLLGVSLLDDDREPIGLIMASDKAGGDFTEEDEALISQLATIASLALQHLSAEGEASHRAAEAQQAKEIADTANRVKDEFLAVLSHELRTPLSAIYMWSQFLRSGNPPPEQLHRGLENIERSVRTQTQLIDDLLDVSRIVSGKLRLTMGTVQMGQVVEAAVATVSHATQTKGIRLDVQLKEPRGSVHGDPDRLQQVVWNLLTNAVKFTPEGGCVTVRLDHVDSAARVSVSDTGQGIEPDMLPYVFERFWQADSSTTRKFGGLGLGLSIVRQLVEMHGGTVRADSEGEGKGATFSFEIPLMRAAGQEEPAPTEDTDAPSSATAPGNGHDADLTGTRVLLVDDDPAAREIVRHLLEERGVALETAGSVREALERLAAGVPDVLLSDIAMPGQDGYDLIRQVRGDERLKGLPAAALTALASEVDRQHALQAGFDEHLAKPLDAHKLIALVASLSQKQGASPEGAVSHSPGLPRSGYPG